MRFGRFGREMRQGGVYTCGKERSTEVVVVLLKEKNVSCE